MTTPRRRGGRGRSSPRRPAEPPALAAPEAVPPPALEGRGESPIPTSVPEPGFAARVPPPEPERPRPSLRRAVFFDVENSSRVEHVGRLLEHLRLDRAAQGTDLVAVGNWRVINHDTARLLARHGAHLIHSAPSVGVRDWSDLRIAVAAGVWLASARAGDAIEIISDDQAFDAVGDVAASLGVRFHRLSYRGLAGVSSELPAEEPVVASGRSRRRRRGGRRRRGEPSAAAVATVAPAANGGAPEVEGHTAPHDELLAVARELLRTHPTATLDMLSNALKAHGFRRTPGSPRLITRLRRIKELEVTRQGIVRLVEANAGGEAAGDAAHASAAVPAIAIEGEGGESPATASPSRRRRRRRGGRGRRRRGGQEGVAAP